MTGRGEAVEVEQGSAVYDRVADLDDALKSDQVFLVDLITPERFGVITEVAQEPAEFPQCFRSAIETARNGASGAFLGLNDREAQNVERFLSMPAILGSGHPDQVQTIRDFVGSRPIGLVQTLDAPPHAAPSFAPR